MISHKTRFNCGIVMLSIGMFVSPTVFCQHQGQTMNLTGTWTLNKDLSDDPARAMAAMHGEGSGRRSGHGPWMHGGGGRGGMDRRQMEAMRRAIEAPARLTIAQAKGSITLTDDGRSQTLTTNNKKQMLPLDNRTVEVRTKWDDGLLVKEMSLGDGMKVTETYSLVSEARQLHVVVKLEGSHVPKPVNLRRVYDAESRQ